MIGEQLVRIRRNDDRHTMEGDILTDTKKNVQENVHRNIVTKDTESNTRVSEAAKP